MTPKFFLLTERYLILRVAERWRAQYAKDIALLNIRHDKNRDAAPTVEFEAPRRAVYDKLLQLDLNTATASQVREIIGNDSWTRQRCDVCGSYTLPAIVSGIRGIHHTTCIDCIGSMNEMIQKGLT